MFIHWYVFLRYISRGKAVHSTNLRKSHRIRDDGSYWLECFKGSTCDEWLVIVPFANFVAELAPELASDCKRSELWNSSSWTVSEKKNLRAVANEYSRSLMHNKKSENFIVFFSPLYNSVTICFYSPAKNKFKQRGVRVVHENECDKFKSAIPVSHQYQVSVIRFQN